MVFTDIEFIEKIKIYSNVGNKNVKYKLIIYNYILLVFKFLVEYNELLIYFSYPYNFISTVV